jgi:hypothetical protein
LLLELVDARDLAAERARREEREQPRDLDGEGRLLVVDREAADLEEREGARLAPARYASASMRAGPGASSRASRSTATSRSVSASESAATSLAARCSIVRGASSAAVSGTGSKMRSRSSATSWAARNAGNAARVPSSPRAAMCRRPTGVSIESMAAPESSRS